MDFTHAARRLFAANGAEILCDHLPPDLHGSDVVVSTGAAFKEPVPSLTNTGEEQYDATLYTFSLLVVNAIVTNT